ncbi:MAG: hypothetical protein ACEQSB_04590 [Undibacterium sp.]
MWEFLSRKKETATVAEPVATPETKAEAMVPVLESVPEKAIEKVNEKYAAILSQTAPAGQSVSVTANVDADATEVGRMTDATTRVNQLVELAQVKGVAHAVAVAQKMNDLYVLDTMHDELADKLYEALKAKGLILGE